MNITEWDPHTASDDELLERYAFVSKIDAEFDPETPLDPFDVWKTNTLQTSPFYESKRWEAFDDAGLVATGWLGLNRTDSNAHLARFNINVRADARRNGVGAEMLSVIADVAEADGRSTLSCGAPKDSPGEAFLNAVGMEQKLLDRRSRLRVKEVDRGLLNDWIADAETKTDDYTLVLFDGEIPEEHVPNVIKVGEVMNDAPRDDLDMEDWHESVEEFQDGQRRRIEMGLEFMLLVVRHDPTGDFIGFTNLDWHPATAQLVWQGGTAVHRDHRGHAIGRWLKATMFNTLLARNPQAEFVDTWNAGTNKWMLAINDDMGYRPYIWYAACDGKIVDIKKAIA